LTKRKKSDIIRATIKYSLSERKCRRKERRDCIMKYSEAVGKLRESGADNARYEAALLFSHFTGIDLHRLISSLDDPDVGSHELISAVEKRSHGYPLQYILGEWEFYGLDFRIREGCLIPRGDTEILVERAISSIPKGACFADVCCGSGCIAVSILKNRPDLTAVAVDLYDIPLSLTKENAYAHKVENRLGVFACDVLAEDGKLEEILSGCSVIVSNPPYIRDSVVPTLEGAVKHEPTTALCGGDDGMDFYRVLTKYAKERGILALFEIGYDQAGLISDIAKNHKMKCNIYKDYSGNDRVAELISEAHAKT